MSFIMKIFYIILFLISSSKLVYADDKIVLMCKQYNTIDYIAVIDLKNRLFDMNELEKGFPEHLRFKISKISDGKIIANAIETTNYKDGSYITWDINVTIDRYLGTIDDSGRKVRDTRKGDNLPNFYLKTFWAKNCEKFNPTKKF